MTRFFTSLKIISFVFSLVVLVSIRNCIPRTKCFVLICFKTATTQQQKKWSNKTQKQLSFGCQLNTNWSVRNETKQHQHQPLHSHTPADSNVCAWFLYADAIERREEKKHKHTHGVRKCYCLILAVSLPFSFVRLFVSASTTFNGVWIRFVFTILFYESYINVPAYIGLSKHTPTPTPNNSHESVSVSIKMCAQVRARQRPLYDAINHEAEQNSREAKKYTRTHQHQPIVDSLVEA